MSRSNRVPGSKSTKNKNNTTINVALSALAQLPQAGSQKEPRIHGRTAAQRADRNARDSRRLAAVSGIVIPSKVPPGQLPDQGIWEEDERSIHPCSICDRKFHERGHVKVHMAACVNRNGNPNGVRWDDAWRNGSVQAGRSRAQPIEPQDLQMEDAQSQDNQNEDERHYDYQLENYQYDHHQSGDSEYPDLPSGGSQSGYSLFENLFNDDVQLASPFSTGPSQHDVELLTERSQSKDFDLIDPQLVSTAPSGLTPYNPNLRVDILTNEALLSMVKAWQEAMHYGEGKYYVDNPHFQKVMEELWKRGIVDETWTWKVDLERLDMAWKRVLV